MKAASTKQCFTGNTPSKSRSLWQKSIRKIRLSRNAVCKQSDACKDRQCTGINKQQATSIDLTCSHLTDDTVRGTVSIDANNTRSGQPLEGQLYKYTNVMKGWQYRWFVLEPNKGRLDYYEKEELKNQKPRGSVHLSGAVISPSDEDSQTFTVNAANGEMYRLRAIDAKERQHWVNRLRATAEHHTETMAQSLPLFTKENRSSVIISNVNPTAAQVLMRTNSSSLDSLHSTSANKSQHKYGHGSLPNHHSSAQLAAACPAQVITASLSDDCFRNVQDMMEQVKREQNELINNIEELPSSGDQLTSLDKDILLLKATSGATLGSLEQCLDILLQHQASISQVQSLPHYKPNVEWLDPQPLQLSLPVACKHALSDPASPAESFVSAMDVVCDGHLSNNMTLSPNNETAVNCEIEDVAEYTDTDLGAIEEHKTIILHLLSQLKLGMDLTKVVLPTFILEKRSLLELFADCMAHPDMFICIPDLPDPEARMIGVVEWYLTSFHAGRQGSIAKKPYNPIIGETFQCSWNIPETFSSIRSDTTNDSLPDNKSADNVEIKQMEPIRSNGTENGLQSLPTATVSHDSHVTEENHSENDTEQLEKKHFTRLLYCAEQVSHHPPVSAFYFECPEKRIYMNASIWTKSKFMGMSIGVMMIGKVKLNLVDLSEEYEFSLPSAYARSILTIPWVELGDKINITCQKTGYSASVTFHTKPFYGGRLHRVTSEIKNPEGELICKVTGEWNGKLEFNFPNCCTKTIDTTKLDGLHKRVRPLAAQTEYESRRLWQQVTESLKKGDINAATQHKHFLEERQRQGERHRKENKIPFPTKYFHKEGDCWVYNNPLKPSETSPC